MQTDSFAISEQLEKDDNEDYFFADDKLQLYIVADGIGGHGGGEIASKFVLALVKDIVKTIDSLMQIEEPSLMEGGIVQQYDYISILKNAFSNAHGQLIKEAEKEAQKNPGTKDMKKMGCTIVLLMFRDNKLYIMNAGDSRCYQYCEGELRRLTRDNSKVARLVQKGEILPEEAELHPERNFITKCVGAEREGDEPDIYYMPACINDRFILCSDGVTKMIEDEKIKAFAKKSDIKSAAVAMMGAVVTAPHDVNSKNQMRKKDNATLMIVDVVGEGEMNDFSQQTVEF